MLSTLTVALTLFTTGPARDDPEPKPTIKPPVVKFLRATKQGTATKLIFEITNPNGTSLPFIGYGDEKVQGPQVAKLNAGVSPVYLTEVRASGAWKDHTQKWCGTGLAPVGLPARGKVTFAVSVPDGEWDAFRTGLQWRTKYDNNTPAQTAWSDPVPRPAAEAKERGK